MVFGDERLGVVTVRGKHDKSHWSTSFNKNQDLNCELTLKRQFSIYVVLLQKHLGLYPTVFNRAGRTAAASTPKPLPLCQIQRETDFTPEQELVMCWGFQHHLDWFIDNNSRELCLWIHLTFSLIHLLTPRQAHTQFENGWESETAEKYSV